MFLSIIIPVFNVEPYLIDCLDSVFVQDLLNCEIITINDGSTDNSRLILSDYQKKKPDLIIIDQTNCGLSAARNAGLKIAKGNYVYFLDSDDYLLTDTVKLFKHCVEKGQADVITFNALVNGETNYVPSFYVSNSIKTGINYFVDCYKNKGNYPFNNVWLYIYRRSFLEYHKLAFFPGLFHEDIAFTSEVFYYAKSIYSVDTPIVNYRKLREGSISTCVNLKNVVDKAIICRNLDKFFRENNFNNIYFYNSLFQNYTYLLSEAIAHKYDKKQFLYFNSEDKKIMRRGVLSNYDYKLWVLASINIRLMVSIYENRLPHIFRRSINILFSLINKSYKLN